MGTPLTNCCGLSDSMGSMCAKGNSQNTDYLDSDAARISRQERKAEEKQPLVKSDQNALNLNAPNNQQDQSPSPQSPIVEYISNDDNDIKQSDDNFSDNASPDYSKDDNQNDNITVKTINDNDVIININQNQNNSENSNSEPDNPSPPMIPSPPSDIPDHDIDSNHDDEKIEMVQAVKPIIDDDITIKAQQPQIATAKPKPIIHDEYKTKDIKSKSSIQLKAQIKTQPQTQSQSQLHSHSLSIKKPAPAAQSTPNLAKYRLPSKLGGIPIELSEKLTADDYVFYNQIKTKYVNKLSQYSIEEHFLFRYTIGYRHIKKKKRLAAITKDVDAYFQFHIKYDLDNICKSKSSSQELNAWKQFIYGEDKYGHPIMYDLIGTSKCDEMQKVFMNPSEPFGDRGFRHCLRFMRKLENYRATNAKKYGKKIYKHIQVMDMKEFTTDHLKGQNKKMTKLMVKTLTQMYPETVYKMYIINAPWPFRALWHVVKAFMDAITVDKTKVLSDEFLKKMLKDIPINMIPKEYGGKGPWEIQYGDVPKNYPIDANHGVD